MPVREQVVEVRAQSGKKHGEYQQAGKGVHQGGAYGRHGELGRRFGKGAHLTMDGRETNWFLPDSIFFRGNPSADHLTAMQNDFEDELAAQIAQQQHGKTRQAPGDGGAATPPVEVATAQ